MGREGVGANRQRGRQFGSVVDKRAPVGVLQEWARSAG
jgi:hypothetical protein